VNDDMNLAAWMIAGGPTRSTFADERTRAHVRALGAGLARPGIADRLSALIAAVRTAPTLAPAAAGAELDPACCAA
jgi:hypothetical protein